MSTLDLPVGGITLDQLDAYLSSDRAPPDSMMLSDLDGFLTAIAIGPEIVMPAEWMPVVWGGEQPGFADEEEARIILSAILGRYNDILNQIERGTVEPIFWTSSDHTVIANDWAEGFLTGVGLRAEAWDPLLKSRKRADILLPILALCDDEHGDSLFGFDAEIEDEVMDTATSAIPACVIQIAAYWRTRRKKGGGDGLTVSTFDVRVAVPAKVGGNDPCPCGSGKKFKKCCGQ